MLHYAQLLMESRNESTADSQMTSPLRDLVLLGQSQPVEMPASLLGRVAAATRPDLALAMTMPAIYGAVMGWWQAGHFSWLTFAFLFTGVFSAALSYQLLSTVYDYRHSLEPDAGATDDLPTTPFAWLAGGALPSGLLSSAGWLLLSLGGMSALWLALLAGWPLLFFSGLSVLLILASFVPPVRYAARGWGMGELGMALAFGALPLLAGYYTQATATLSWLPLWGLAGLATLPLALGPYSDLHRNEVKPEDGYRLRDIVAKAAIWTGILQCLALWISRAG